MTENIRAIMPDKGKRLSGFHRERAEKFAREAYVDNGRSIRDIAEEMGRSYGFVHRLLSEMEGVTLRSRGGAPGGRANKGKKRTKKTDN